MIKALLATNACLLAVTCVMNFDPNKATGMCVLPGLLALLNIVAIAFSELESE